MKLDPTTVSNIKNEAEALFTKGKFKEALAGYEKIKAYGEKDPRIYLRMGDIARKVGDDIYAGKDGTVYRKGEKGWEQNSGSGWNQVQRPPTTGQPAAARPRKANTTAASWTCPAPSAWRRTSSWPR